MKKFNEYKERVIKIRVVSAPAGEWYEDLIGSNVETIGYNQYDHENKWYVNCNGEEKLINHNDARVILSGGYARWSTILVKGRGAGDKDRVAVLTGESFGGLQVHYVNGGSSVIRKEDIAQVLDEGKCYNDSSAYNIADFYDHWKEKDMLVCPYCKSNFEYFSFLDETTLKCRACEDEDNGKKGIRLDSKMFNDPEINLTDEDIRKHNSEVLYRHFEKSFKNNTGNLDPNYRGYISGSAPETIMEAGAKIRYHYDLLGEDRVNELRILFKKCYKNALHVLKEKDKRNKERESWSDLEKKIGRKIQ